MGEPGQGALDVSFAEGAAARGRSPGELAGRIAFAATAVFLAQLYIAPSDWFPQLAPLRLALALSCLALAGIALHRVLSGTPLWLGWRTAALFVYVATAALSPLWSMDQPTSIDAAFEVCKHFVFFLAVTNTATSPGRIRTALLLFAAAAVVPGLGTYIHYARGELLVEGFRGRWYGVMGDPNHDAMALVAATPVAFLLLVSGRRLWHRAVGLGSVIACLMGIVATHSRGGSVGLGVALLTFALLSKRKALALGAGAIAAAAMVALAPSTFWTRNETIASYQQDESVHGRMQAWHVAGRAIQEHPVTGVGEQAFLAAWDHYAPLDAGKNRYVAHNLFLEVLAELGVLGLSGLLVFLGAAVWSLWRARSGPMGPEARALLAALFGYIVCQQFSGYSLSWFLYALCAFAACVDHWAPRPRQPVPEPVPPLARPIRVRAAVPQ